MATAEELRAAEWRAARRRRAQAERVRQTQLAGSKAAYDANYERTRALMRYDAAGVPQMTTKEPDDGREQGSPSQ